MKMGKQNSFFKESISSIFCIKQRKKINFFSAGNIKVEKKCTRFFYSDSGNKNDRIEYESHLAL